jgi:excinuclease ABC subunit A
VGGNTRKRTLWILDEPSRGLHPQDTLRLGAIFDELVASGDTVLAISHDPVLMSRCDRVVELGPGAGAAGGRLLYAGDPRGLADGQFPSSACVKLELDA